MLKAPNCSLRSALFWGGVSLAPLMGFCAAGKARAGSYAPVYGFSGMTDGASPFAGLTADRNGYLYGTTQYGGTICADQVYYGCGVLFRIDASGKVQPLHSFAGGGEGSQPTAPVTIAGGKIFGATNRGPTDNGVLFSANTDGSDFTILHQFDGSDGSQMEGALQASAGGELFGVTARGGSANGGVLFSVTPGGAYRVRHDFVSDTGIGPSAVLIAPSGELFGTASGGGSCGEKAGCGTIFEYSPATGAYTVLYSFQGGEAGYGPTLGGIGADGTLYGVADGGAYRHGLLFSFNPRNQTGGITVLASFRSSAPGDAPIDAPTLTPDGSLVGALNTYLYAYHNGKLSELLAVSAAAPVDENGQLYVGRDGTIYGTSTAGGVTPCVFSTGFQNVSGCGEIFSLSPYPASN